VGAVHRALYLQRGVRALCEPCTRIRLHDAQAVRVEIDTFVHERAVQARSCRSGWRRVLEALVGGGGVTRLNHERAAASSC
jgi:hypothetical protein